MIAVPFRTRSEESLVPSFDFLDKKAGRLLELGEHVALVH